MRRLVMSLLIWNYDLCKGIHVGLKGWKGYGWLAHLQDSEVLAAGTDQLDVYDLIYIDVYKIGGRVTGIFLSRLQTYRLRVHVYCVWRKEKKILQYFKAPSIFEWSHAEKGPYIFFVFFCFFLFFFCGSSNVHVQWPIWTTDMHFCLKLPRVLYYISVNSKDSGGTDLMCRLAWAFAGRLSHKYAYLLC